jgi:ABC-type nitrate/sulfonate/bicarbonate transport system substrate-binding protein
MLAAHVLRAILVSAAAILLPAGCSGARGSDAKNAGEYETLELRMEGFAGTVTPAELAEDLGYLAPLKLKYVGNSISGPANIQNVATGDVDVGGAFNGAVVKLMAAKAPVKAVIGYYGVDDKTWNGFFVPNESPIREPKDLLGKKIAMNTLGAHSEFMLKEFLFRNGVNAAQAEQVTLVVVPPTIAEQSLRQRQVDVSALSGIFRDRALERGGIRHLFSDYELFGTFTAGSYVMRNDFIRDKPNTVRKFVQGTAKAIEWARSTPRDQVVARLEDIVKRRGRNEDTSAIKFWQSYGVAGVGGRLSDRDYQVWIDWLVKDGELTRGQIAAKDLYTTQFHAPGST